MDVLFERLMCNLSIKKKLLSEMQHNRFCDKLSKKSCNMEKKVNPDGNLNIHINYFLYSTN